MTTLFLFTCVSRLEYYEALKYQLRSRFQERLQKSGGESLHLDCRQQARVLGQARVSQAQPDKKFDVPSLKN